MKRFSDWVIIAGVSIFVLTLAVAFTQALPPRVLARLALNAVGGADELQRPEAVVTIRSVVRSSRGEPVQFAEVILRGSGLVRHLGIPYLGKITAFDYKVTRLASLT